MSPTDRRAATRSGTAPTDHPDLRRADRNGGEPASPVAVPEIVPATDDGQPADPGAGPRGDAASVEPDATERWVDSGTPPVVVGSPTGASAPLRVRGRRPRVRKVTRVVRHLDPWSTFKVAAIFSLVLYGVLMTSGVLLWNVAANTGTLDNVERWFTQFGWESFELDGGEVYSNAWVAGLFGVVALTGFAVLLATLFNLVSDMVGGVRVTVLEEEVVERTTNPTRRYVVRRMPNEPGAASSPGSAVSTTSADWHVDTADGDGTGDRADTDPAKPWRTMGHRSTVRTARPVDN